MERTTVVIDVSDHATIEEAAAALNAPGNSYSLVQVLPVPGAHRAYFRRRITEGERPAQKRNSKELDARLTAAVRAMFQPDERVIYHPSFGSEAGFYRWRKRALKDGVLVASRGWVYFAAAGIQQP